MESYGKPSECRNAWSDDILASIFELGNDYRWRYAQCLQEHKVKRALV